ncbi:hypothetical protein WDW37_15225 [Bdellovibrionota bacterium FG-1]
MTQSMKNMNLSLALSLLPALVFSLGAAECGPINTDIAPHLDSIELVADHPTLDADTQNTEYSTQEARLTGSQLVGVLTDLNDPAAIDSEVEVQMRWVWLHPNDMRAISTDWQVLDILSATDNEVDVRVPRMSHAGKLEFKINVRGRGWSDVLDVDVHNEFKGPTDPLIETVRAAYDGPGTDHRIKMNKPTLVFLTGPNMFPSDTTGYNSTYKASAQWRQVSPMVTEWTNAGVFPAAWTPTSLIFEVLPGDLTAMVPGMVEIRVYHPDTGAISNVVAAMVFN